MEVEVWLEPTPLSLPGRGLLAVPRALVCDISILSSVGIMGIEPGDVIARRQTVESRERIGVRL